MTNSKRNENATTVLIVGAGPTGLTLACALTRREVYRLIEAVPGEQPDSRGKGIQPRTLEVFEAQGGATLLADGKTGQLCKRDRVCIFQDALESSVTPCEPENVDVVVGYIAFARNIFSLAF